LSLAKALSLSSNLFFAYLSNCLRAFIASRPGSRVFLLGSDDFPAEAKTAAARDLNAALEAKWPGLENIQQFPLSTIASAHEYVESRKARRRVIVRL
jgi:hypothetical protein